MEPGCFIVVGEEVPRKRNLTHIVQLKAKASKILPFNFGPSTVSFLNKTKTDNVVILDYECNHWQAGLDNVKLVGHEANY